MPGTCHALLSMRAENLKAPPLTHLAATLRAARQKRGLSIAETARAIRVEYATFTNWEAGRTEPKASAFIRWCLFLDVDPKIFIT